MVTLFLALFLVACGLKSKPLDVSLTKPIAAEAPQEDSKPSPVEEPPSPSPPEKENQLLPVGPDLSRVLKAAPEFFHPAMRENWPAQDWVSAKAYTFNFQNEGRVKLRVYDGEWNKTIRQTIPLSKEAAEAALELTHRTAGAVHASKCPLPRHAVVFFNELGDPVASVNVCFSCSDIMVWPNYGSDALKSKKYANWEKMETIHAHALSRWQLFFDGVGADSYQGK